MMGSGRSMPATESPTSTRVPGPPPAMIGQVRHAYSIADYPSLPAWPEQIPGPDRACRTDLPVNGARCFQLDSLVSTAEAGWLVEQAEQIGFSSVAWEYAKEYRDCERLVAMSPSLAEVLWSRIVPVLTREDVMARPYGFGNEGVWRPVGVNPCVRLSKYTSGGKFETHRDGGFVVTDDHRSVYTISLYLNDSGVHGSGALLEGAGGEFTGGALELSGADGARFPPVTVHPKRGMAVVFNHDALHKGCTVLSGTKYILRSDIMFERCTPMRALQPSYRDNPRYIEAERLYQQSIDEQQQGRPAESTQSYLAAMEIQAELPSLLHERRLELGDSWSPALPLQMLMHLLGWLGPRELNMLSEVSITWCQVARDGEPWSGLFYQRWGANIGLEQTLSPADFRLLPSKASQWAPALANYEFEQGISVELEVLFVDVAGRLEMSQETVHFAPTELSADDELLSADDLKWELTAESELLVDRGTSQYGQETCEGFTLTLSPGSEPKVVKLKKSRDYWAAYGAKALVSHMQMTIQRLHVDTQMAKSRACRGGIRVKVPPHLVDWYARYRARRIAELYFQPLCLHVGFTDMEFGWFDGKELRRKKCPALVARSMGHLWGAGSGLKQHLVGDEVGDTHYRGVKKARQVLQLDEAGLCTVDAEGYSAAIGWGIDKFVGHNSRVRAYPHDSTTVAEFPVLIAEPMELSFSVEVRQSLTNWCRTLRVPSLCILPAPVCVLCGVGFRSGLVAARLFNHKFLVSAVQDCVLMEQAHGETESSAVEELLKLCEQWPALGSQVVLWQEASCLMSNAELSRHCEYIDCWDGSVLDGALRFQGMTDARDFFQVPVDYQ